MAAEIIEVEVWVMVDENGAAEVSQDPGELQAEAGLASRMVKVVVMVPKPRPVQAVVTIEDEPDNVIVTA